jgi:hypothetical protein
VKISKYDNHYFVKKKDVLSLWLDFGNLFYLLFITRYTKTIQWDTTDYITEEQCLKKFNFVPRFFVFQFGP